MIMGLRACVLLLIATERVFVQSMDVVVVGAGIAGISAARKLTNHPGVRVTVLEGRPDRYGGRIWTNGDAFPNATGCEVEMGAGWIHGMNDANPITQLQRKLNLDIFNTCYDNMTVFSSETGGKYSANEVDDSWDSYTQARYKIFSASADYEKDISYAEAIRKEGLTGWANLPLSQFFLTSDMEAIEGAPLNKISTKNYNPKANSEGFSGDDSLVVGGYSQIVDSLVNGYGASEKPLKIQLNKEVIRIDVDESNQTVTVRTHDGHSYVCDAVVVAVPLGVLKAGVITFSPPLPSVTRDAIKNIGFGNVNKFIMEFDEVFWPEDSEVVGLAGDLTNDRGFLWVWFNMYPVVRRPVLVGFLDGQAAYTSENFTDQQLTEKALQLFEKVFGESVVRSRKIVQAVATRWASDRFARGSYSYTAVGNTDATWLSLSSSVCPHIYFAGEHAMPGFIGNVHGAYMSGARAADHIIQPHMCKSKISSANLLHSMLSSLTVLVVILTCYLSLIT